jgi:acyl dehydratase
MNPQLPTSMRILKTEFGQRLVNGIFTLGVVVGISVPN